MCIYPTCSGSYRKPVSQEFPLFLLYIREGIYAIVFLDLVVYRLWESEIVQRIPMWSDFHILNTGREGESMTSLEVSMLSSMGSWRISPCFLRLVKKPFPWF